MSNGVAMGANPVADGGAPQESRHQAISKGIQLVLAFLSIPSVALNIYQGVNNEQDHRYIQRLEARDKLEKQRKEKRDNYIQKLEAATSEADNLIGRMDAAAAFTIRDRAETLRREKEELTNSIVAAEQDYHNRFDSSYPVSPKEELARLGNPPYLDRVFGILNEHYLEMRRLRNYDKFETLFRFASDIDKKRVVVLTIQSVNVRSEPENTGGNSVAAVPAGTPCYIVSVKPDGSWFKVRGAAPGPFEGWVYTEYVQIPAESFLRAGS